MQSKSSNPDDYMAELPEERVEPMTQLRKAILKNLPKGFREVMQYGMLGYVVPHELYPAGYHCDPKQPLPFMCLASQKQYISFYHMGLYGDAPLLKWFTEAYAKEATGKLDMGKSCIRFKQTTKIPYKLIGELVKKMSVKDWISLYEKSIKR